MIGVSEKQRFDVTLELYPAFEPGQDAARRAVVVVDSAGRLGGRAERGDCAERESGLRMSHWLLVIGDLGGAPARLRLEITNRQSPMTNDQ